jgi:hypothetical protein
MGPIPCRVYVPLNHAQPLSLFRLLHSHSSCTCHPPSPNNGKAELLEVPATQPKKSFGPAAQVLIRPHASILPARPFVHYFPQLSHNALRCQSFITMQHDLVLRWLAWVTAAAEHSDLWKRSVSDDGNTYQLASPVMNPPAEGVDSPGQLPDDRSIASTTSSARNLAALERTSVRRRSFNGIGPLPRELQGIASQLQRIGRGQGIISKEDRVRLESEVTL